MANTKVTGDLLADGTLFARHLNESHGITTSVIGEGTNLYYTNDRVSSYLSSNGYATSTAIIASIVDSAPSTLDTLNELAAALGDDPNFATTVTTAIATKVDGTGTASYLMKWSDSNTATNSVIYDDGTNVGLGVIPSGWGGSSKALQIGSRMSLYNDGFNNALFGNNTYFNGSDNYYINTAAAARFYIENTGKFIWNQAASGTAGNAISFTQAMTLNASGNLSIGTTSTHGNLTVEQTTGESGITVNSSIAEPPTVYLRDAGGAGYSRLLANNKLHIDASQVGIGTTSPSGTYGKLSVAGGIRILDDNNAKLEIGRYSSGASNSYIKLGSLSNSLRITNNTDTIDIFTVVNDGNVGIGTTAPAAKLEIFGTGNTLRLDSAANGAKELLFRNVGTQTATIKTDGHLKLYTEDAGRNIYFDTSGGTKAIILDNGNVGIGTTSPSAKLDARLSGTSSGAVIQVGNVGSGGFGGLGISDGGTYPLQVWGSSIAFLSGNSSYASATERMRIDSSGNVGIGTTSPQAPLHVIAASTNNDALIQEWSYNSSDQDKYSLMLKQTVTSGVVRYNFSMVNNNTAYNDVLVLDRGKVGIGTTSPEYRLDVKSSGGAGLRVQTAGATFGGPSIALLDSANVNEGIITMTSSGMELGTYSNSNLYFKTNQSTKMTILNGGNVGIGTTSPGYKLSVEGGDIQLNNNNAAANYYLRLNKKEGQDGGILMSRDNTFDFQIVNVNTSGDLWAYAYGAGSVAMAIKRSNAYVGIGTTSPAAKLDVHGTTRVRSSSSSIYTTSLHYSAEGNTTTNVSFDISSEFGISNNGYVLVEITLSAYGNAGSGGGVYKYIAGGFSGHTIANAGYHKYEVIANTVNGNVSSFSPYNPTYNVYGVTIVNSSGYFIAGVMEIRVTTTY